MQYHRCALIAILPFGYQHSTVTIDLFINHHSGEKENTIQKRKMKINRKTVCRSLVLDIVLLPSLQHLVP